MPASRPPGKPWYTSLTIDMILKVLANSIFHPFVASLIPLCLRAVQVSYSAPQFRYTVYYAIGVCALSALAPLSDRLAYGAARKVEPEEEVIVITGGASGLGRCIAEIYAMRGASVAVLDVRAVGAGTAVEGVSYFRCDVGDAAEVRRAWKRITQDLGVPTILIHSAAIVHGKKAVELTVEEAEKTFRTNVTSQYHLNSLFLPPLLTRPNGGTLVTISSVLARLGAAHLSAYTASKAALLAYHASLSAELAVSAPHIKTILATPGQLTTELFSGLEQGPIANFFGPVVEVQDLAMKLVRMVDEGKGGVVVEPAYARWIGVLELMPVGVQRVVRRWAGVDTAMEGWRGHAVQGGVEEKTAVHV